VLIVGPRVVLLIERHPRTGSELHDIEIYLGGRNSEILAICNISHVHNHRTITSIGGLSVLPLPTVMGISLLIQKLITGGTIVLLLV